MYRTSISILIAIFVAMSLAVGLSAANAGNKKAAPKKVVSAICPVMGNKIPDITKAPAKSVYKGKTYYFCCKGCKPEFDKNPEKYVNKQTLKK